MADAPSTTVLQFEIAPGDSRVILTRKTTPSDQEAAAVVANPAGARDLACRLLQGVAIRDAEACGILFSAASDATKVESAIEGGKIEIRVIRSIPTADLFAGSRDFDLRLSRPIDASLQLEFVAKAPYFLAGAWPAPSTLDRQRIAYAPDALAALDFLAGRGADIRFFVEQDYEAAHRFPQIERGPPSLLDYVDAASRERLLSDLGRGLRRLGECCASLLPLVLFLGYIGQRNGARSQAASFAARAAILLGALTVVGPLSQSFYLNLAYKLRLMDRLSEFLSGIGAAWVPSIRLDNLLMSGADRILDLAAQSLQLPVLALVLWVLARAFAAWRWPAQVRLSSPLLMGWLLMLLAFLIPEAFSGVEQLNFDRPSVWPFEFYAGLVGILVAVVGLTIARALCRLFLVIPSALVLAAFGILIVVALQPAEPMSFTYSDFYRPEGVSVVGPLLSNGGYYIAALAAAALLLPVLGILPRGAGALGGKDVQHATDAGMVLFLCALAAPGYAGWWGVAAIVAAIPIWNRLIITSRRRRRRRRRWLTQVHADIGRWVEKLERAAELQSAARSSALSTKLASGEMTPTRWSRARFLLEGTRDRAVEAVYLPDGTPVREIVLGVAMERDPWRRGRRAVLWALPIVVVLTVANALQVTAASSPFPLLLWLGNVVPRVTEMLALAFLFGYFFDLLRGETGLHKALLVSAGLCLAELPLWLPRLTDAPALPALLWSFSQHFLVLIPIGVIAFDYARMRDIEGQRFDWRRFTWFGDARILSAGVAATAAAVAPAVAGLVSSSFADAIKNMATAVAPVLPTGQ